MEIGKLPENMLRRSVLKNITGKQKQPAGGPGVGKDCSVVDLGEEKVCSITGSAYVLKVPDTEELALYGVLNNMAAAQADAVAVWLHVLMPSRAKESKLRNLMTKINAACKANGVYVAGGHTEVTDAVQNIVICMNGIGTYWDAAKAGVTKVEPDMDIIMTKWAGLEGTYLLAKGAAEKLSERLPKHFMDEVDNFGRYISVKREAEIAGLHNVSYMHDASNGGIYGALWELAEGTNTGIEIDLRKIPVRQETIEICEQLELNPYMLDARGTMLMIARQGHHLVEALEEEGIPCALIGHTTDNNDKLILNEEERRYLELPKPDELYKIL